MTSIQTRGKGKKNSASFINQKSKNVVQTQSKKAKKSSKIGDSSSESSSDEDFVTSSTLRTNPNSLKYRPDPTPEIDFSQIEKNIFSGVTRLSESDSDSSDEKLQPIPKKNTKVETESRKSLRLSRSVKSRTLQKRENNDKLSPNVKSDDPKKKEVRVKSERRKSPSSLAVKNNASPSSKAAKQDVPIEEKVQKTSSDNQKRKKLKDSDHEEKPKKRNFSEMNASTSKNIDNLDVAQLLALGESLAPNSSEKQEPLSSDSDEDWEEVNTESKAHSFPKEGIQITLDVPELRRHHKRRCEDVIQAEMNRALNRVRKQLQILYHKVSLLGWLSHGMFLNRILNSDILKALALSVIPNEGCYPPEKAGAKYLEQLAGWFGKTFEFSDRFLQVERHKPAVTLVSSLVYQFSRKFAKSKRDLVLLFVCVARALDLDCRLIISLQPMSVKPPSHELFSNKRKSLSKKEEDLSPEKKKPKHEDTPSTSKYFQGSPNKNSEPKTENKSASKKIAKSSLSKYSQQPSKEKRTLRSRSKENKYKDESESDFESKPQKNCKEGTNKGTAATKKIKKVDKGKGKKKKANSSCDEFTSPESDSSDEEFEAKSERYRPNAKKTTDSKKKENKIVLNKSLTPKKSTPNKKRIKVLSSDDELDAGKLKKTGMDFWAEIYLKAEKQWICVDVPRARVNCTKEIQTRATQPITYVMAFNVDGTVKDITQKYAPQYTQVTVKNRVDQKWWLKAYQKHMPKLTAREREENGFMATVELDRPMPTTVSQCKNHPLYVLKRHLLKFEAIYPPDAPTLGFLKGKEPLYARQCVYTLHSREIWLKEAKVVKPGEEPYKIVKARPKYDRLTGKVITDLPLEIFGPWQVQDYIPPTAKDGIVPRNAYGNVELFKPTMLPKGCVHLQIPGLCRVAKKLKIDCAPAVVGFDFHSGGCHPTLDGFVVCEEFADKLLDAWNRDIDESAKRREEKHEKRVYGNWRRLIKGVLIREHLKYRYNFDEQNKGAGSGSTINPEALNAARVLVEDDSTPSLFPKLMAKVRSAASRSAASSSKTKSAKKTQPKAKAKPSRSRKSKAESSEEEEEEEEEASDWGSTTTEEEDEMILHSDEGEGFGDEDSDSDFE